MEHAPGGHEEFYKASEAKAAEFEVALEHDEELIEQEIDEYLADKPEFKAAFDALQKGRQSGNQQVEQAASGMIQKLRTEAKTALGYAATGQDQDESYRQRVLATLETVSDEESDKETLEKLGMLNDEGKFQYPKSLFSEQTNEAWDKYVLAVKEHLSLAEQVATLEVNHDELQALNIVRRRRHNELARSMMQDLLMDDTPGNFAEARKLAAKMRDVCFPNTGEVELTASFTKNLMAKLRHEEGEAA